MPIILNLDKDTISQDTHCHTRPVTDKIIATKYTSNTNITASRMQQEFLQSRKSIICKHGDKKLTRAPRPIN